MWLVEEKCKQSGVEFDVSKIFSNANKIRNRWEKDMIHLLNEDVSFLGIMMVLSNYFELKKNKPPVIKE